MLSDVDGGLGRTKVLVGDSRVEELTICTIKTGVNDFLDYFSLFVSLLVPLVAGPLASFLVWCLYNVCKDSVQCRPTSRQDGRTNVFVRWTPVVAVVIGCCFLYPSLAIYNNSLTRNFVQQ